MILTLVLPAAQVRAQTRSLGATDLLNGSMQYGSLQLTNQNTQLSLQQGLVGSWDSSMVDGMQPGQNFVRGITSYAYGPNDRVYSINATSGQCFFKAYDVEQQQWNTLKTIPVSCGAGTHIVSDGSQYIYCILGGSTGLFYRYNIGLDSWDQLREIPSQVSGYSDATYITKNSNGYIYLLRGASSSAMLRYTVATNQWDTMASFPASSGVAYGAQIVWDQADTIYGVSNRFGEFKKYTISTNTWTNINTISGLPSNTHFGLNYVAGSIIAVKVPIYPDILHPLLSSYNIATNTWTELPVPPGGPTTYDWSPPVAYDGSRYIYTMLGTEIYQEMRRYDTQTQSWNSVSLYPGTGDDTDWHHSPVYDGSHAIYYAGGTTSDSFDRIYKYDLSTKQAIQIGSQIGTKSGWKGVYKSGALYMLPYAGYSTFQKYDTATNSWTQLSDLPFTTNWGLDIIDGNDGYLYVTFGSRTNFYRYKIADNTWEALASSPANISGGGGLARVGTSIYASGGGSSGYFMKYNMTNNTWSWVTTNYMPSAKIDLGGTISTDGSRYIYVGAATRTDESSRRLYRFDTTDSTWQRLANIPMSPNVNASSFYDTTNSKLYVTESWHSARMWAWSPSATNYVTSGTWYSKSISLTQVQAWQPLQTTTGGTGTSTVYTRTSSNGRLWTAWQAVTGTTINSPVNKYIQLKITLTGDGISTPTLSGINIQYDQEAVAPSLPSQFLAYSKSGSSTQLNSGQTYEYEHPYFTWSGASDGSNGSGIDGYYVYFGTDSSADPVTDGNYQSDTSYAVAAPMTAGSVYYVRIKVKDKLGNVSAAATYFSYRYWYISPPGSQVMTSDADFSNGVNTRVSISNGAMKLRSLATGSWSTGSVDSLPDTPYGSSEVIIGDYLYMMRGNSTTTMWRYDLLNRVWQTMANAPGSVTTGSSMTYDKSRYIYTIAGGNTTSFYRYDTVNDTWTTLVNLPSGAQLGSDIAYVGGGKIAMFFTGGREFYLYDITTQLFDTRQSYPSAVLYGGSGIWYDGSDSVYVNMGMDSMWNFSDNNRVVLAKYSISTDTWKSLAIPPVTPAYTQNNLVSDGRGGLYMVSSDAMEHITANQMAIRYDIASDTWSEANGLTSQVYYGSMVSDNSRYIYIVPSNAGNSRQLIRYDTLTQKYTPTTKNIDKWERLPWDAPSNAWLWYQGNATTAAYDGSKYIYVIGADEGGFIRFARLDPDTGETITLPSPYYANVGGSIAYLNGYLYYMRSGSSQELMRFDLGSKVWTRMADIPVVAYRPGASALQTVGSSLYVMTGNGTGWYTYTPNAGTGTWTQKANIPSAELNGSAVYDNVNGYIYVIRGNGTNNFFRYSIASNTWSTMASLPTTSTYGSAMVIKNGKIYAAIGNLTTNMYVYDVSGDSWSTGTAAPEKFLYGSIFLSIDSNRAFAFAGDNSPDMWQFNYPSATTAYEGNATHISQTFTIPGIYDYAGITAQVNIPAGTSVEFSTRTSDDGSNWSNWSLSSNTKYYNGQLTTMVTSTPRTYTQVKVVLESSDNLYTPTVDSYALNYYYDVDPPSNPSVIHVYKTPAKAEELTSGTWYNNANPVFDWPDPGDPGGATDGPLGSNLAGYWVYLGTDPTASPRTAGQFVTSTQLIPNLTISGTYYLRIQAQDVTGNVDGNIYAPFIYKFDADPPTTPSFITVTPGGYTTSNKFTFDWPAAYDGYSGISGYCYHTGATSGPFAAETCQSGRNLTNISAAYRPGTNVLYVRTLDNAGNYSSSYTTVSYYYTTDPPSPPTNLRAIPPSSPENLFAFAWDLPSLYSGDPDQIAYCYSVNELPSAINTTCTTNRFISAFKAATRQGTNVLYMVTKDEANNVNWNNYATANFIANTVSPGIPLNLVVTDTSDRVSGRWSLTMTWNKPTFEGNGIASYVIERSLDGHSFSEIGKTSTVAFVDLDVLPAQVYYYRVRATDSVDNRGGPSGTVSGTPQGSFTTPPSIVVQPQGNSGFDQATIHWVTNRESTSFVYYGTNPSDLGQSKGSLTLTADHTVTITGLDPSSTYYYRVQSFDNERTYSLADAFSQIFYVKTTEAARIFNVSTDNTALTSTVIDWQTSVPTRARIEYGMTPAYGLSETSDDGLSSDHTFKLKSLDSGTTYHYRIVATTAFGSTIRSDDYTVTTVSRPVINNVRFNPLLNDPTTSVKLSWNTNVPTSSTVRYQGTGVALETSKSELTTSHEITLRNLASSSDYVFNFEGRDQYGNLTTSEQQRWRSGYDTRPPAISNMSYSMTTTEGVANTRAQLIVSWKTDEPSTSQIAYGKHSSGKLDKMTPLDTEPTTNHVVIVSNLDLADIYKVQILSSDISGNKSYGTQTSVVTPDKESSVLDNVITLMQKLFRF